MDISQNRASLTYGFFKKKLWFDFDMLAWFILYQDYGWEFEDIGKQPPEKLMTEFLVSAAKSYAIKNGKTSNLTYPKLLKILENSKTSDSDRLKAVFTQSSKSIPLEIADKIGGVESKKKQHGKT